MEVFIRVIATLYDADTLETLVESGIHDLQTKKWFAVSVLWMGYYFWLNRFRCSTKYSRRMLIPFAVRLHSFAAALIRPNVDAKVRLVGTDDGADNGDQKRTLVVQGPSGRYLVLTSKYLPRITRRVFMWAATPRRRNEFLWYRYLDCAKGMLRTVPNCIRVPSGAAGICG